MVDEVAQWLLEEALGSALEQAEQQAAGESSDGESVVRHRHETMRAEAGEMVAVDV